MVQLIELEEKYDIKQTGNAPELITFIRLRFMFPTIFVPLNGQVVRAHCKGGFSHNLKKEYHATIPGSFAVPEFAGLIPIGHCLDEEARKAIIVLHLYSLEQRFPSTSFRACQIFTRRRILSGLLTDERRFHWLNDKGIIEIDGEMTYEIMEAYYILNGYYSAGRNFEGKIDWDLMNGTANLTT